MHTTDAGKKRKTLRAEALELVRDARAVMKAARALPDAGEKAHELEGRADLLKAEAEDLNNVVRLEDLNVWVMEKVKTTKKGSRTYGYWMASWREGSKVRNVHLGSCMKISREKATEKARMMKAEALGIRVPN